MTTSAPWCDSPFSSFSRQTTTFSSSLCGSFECYCYALSEPGQEGGAEGEAAREAARERRQEGKAAEEAAREEAYTMMHRVMLAQHSDLQSGKLRCVGMEGDGVDRDGVGWEEMGLIGMGVGWEWDGSGMGVEWE